MRCIYELTTEEAYRLVREVFGHELPPLNAVENEDWAAIMFCNIFSGIRQPSWSPPV